MTTPTTTTTTEPYAPPAFSPTSNNNGADGEPEIFVNGDTSNYNNYPAATATAFVDTSAATAPTAAACGKYSSSIPEATATPILNINIDAATSQAPFCDFNVSQFLDRQQINKLRNDHNFPSGLAQEMGKTRASFPLRFWVVDNSGSMRTNDGKRMRGSSNTKMQIVPCNRWAELQDTVCYHAELAGLLEATTIFRLLNPPPPFVGPQEFSVAETTTSPSTPNRRMAAAGNTIQSDVERAKNIMLAAEPTGVTPLTEHLMEIRRRIQASEHILRNNGQRAVIVLATDGLPSNARGESTTQVQKEFIDALRTLQDLPVWVVVRLCTDDDSIVQYYNNLDSVLELPLEVIDDFFGEGEEVHRVNKWLNYALPLQRCREMGYHSRVFDLLDERLLNKDELRTFLELLLGKSAIVDAPDVHADWKGFVQHLKKAVNVEGKQYNPNTQRMDYWIDFRELERAYGNKGLFAKMFR